MLACFRPRAPEKDSGPDPARKPLWACEKPSEAADVLRSIGLTRLAATAVSSQLSGHVLAHFLDNLPAEHFLAPREDASGGQPSAAAAQQQHAHEQQSTQEALQASQRKTIRALPLPKSGHGARPVSVYDYKLVDSPQHAAAQQQAAPTTAQQQSANSSANDDDIIDIIPSARSPLKEYSDCTPSSHLALGQELPARSIAVEDAAHSGPAQDTEHSIAVRDAAHGGPVQDTAHSSASDQAPTNVINVSVRPARSWQMVASVNGREQEAPNPPTAIVQGDDAANSAKDTDHRRRLLVGTKHFPSASRNNSTSPPRVRSSWRDSSQNGKHDHGIHTSASLGLPQVISVATAPQRATQWQGEVAYRPAPASPDRNLIARHLKQPERAQEGQAPAVLEASAKLARTVPVVHSLPQVNGVSAHAESSSHNRQMASVDASSSRAPEFKQNALGSNDASTMANSSEKARSPFEAARRRFSILGPNHQLNSLQANPVAGVAGANVVRPRSHEQGQDLTNQAAPKYAANSNDQVSWSSSSSSFTKDSSVGNAGWEGTTAATGVAKKQEFGRFRAFLSHTVGAPTSTSGSDMRPTAMQWSVGVSDTASPNQRQTTGQGQPWQTKQDSAQASIRLEQSLRSAPHPEPHVPSSIGSVQSSSLEASPSKPKIFVPKLWREGSTPRTPAAAAAASGAENVYKVAPGVDYDNSEYSSSDDDTSYGGKRA